MPDDRAAGQCVSEICALHRDGFSRLQTTQDGLPSPGNRTVYLSLANDSLSDRLATTGAIRSSLFASCQSLFPQRKPPSSNSGFPVTLKLTLRGAFDHGTHVTSCVRQCPRHTLDRDHDADLRPADISNGERRRDQQNILHISRLAYGVTVIDTDPSAASATSVQNGSLTQAQDYNMSCQDSTTLRRALASPRRSV